MLFVVAFSLMSAVQRRAAQFPVVTKDLFLALLLSSLQS